MDYTKSINAIITSLIAISTRYFEYDNDKKKALEDFRGLALDNRINELKAALKVSISYSISELKKSANDILENVKNGNRYDINDSSVANASRLLSKPGVSFKTVDALLKGFAGNQVALDLIKASSDPSYAGFFKYYQFDNEKAVEDIISTIGLFETQAPENYPGFVSMMREKLNDFALHQGLDVSLASDELDEMRFRNIAGLMGIDYNNIK